MPAKKAPLPAPAPVDFQPIRSTRAFEDIEAQIRTELAEGRLKLGDRLPSERVLAEQFGVSRNTLREALRNLENAGLITLLKGASGGAFISEPTGDAIITGMLDLYRTGAIRPPELTQARIWLETIIVREACARMTPEDHAELEKNIAEAEEAAARNDFPARALKNLEFHRILARMTENRIMVLVMDGVLNVLYHFIQTIGEYPNDFVIASRRRFMKHMREGDVNAAVAEMETSLTRLQRGYLSRMDAPAPAPLSAPARKSPQRS